MTKTGPVDSPSNPFAIESRPETLGEGSSSKPVSKIPWDSPLTPIDNTSNADIEGDTDTGKMALESKKGMSNRRDNKAPSYNRNRPEELLRYIEDVDKEMIRPSITVDQDKKD